MIEYYIASEQGPLGPYTLEQLNTRRLKSDDLVWFNGLTEWVKAADVPQLAEVIGERPIPPTFNRLRYESAASYEQGTPAVTDDDEEQKCPPTYRWLAIIAFLGIIPCAIVSLIKSTMVSRLWEEGNYDGARKQSRSALQWGLIGLLIGLPLSAYIMFSDADVSLIRQIFEIFD